MRAEDLPEGGGKPQRLKVAHALAAVNNKKIINYGRSTSEQASNLHSMLHFHLLWC